MIELANTHTVFVHILVDASVNRGILPRPKNMPPACFLNGLSNPAAKAK